MSKDDAHMKEEKEEPTEPKGDWEYFYDKKVPEVRLVRISSQFF